jgi:uncharacterized coiled-coil protein SlyX
MADPTPEALATAEAVFTLFMHDRGMPGWIWHRQATPDNVELVARIAQTLTEQAREIERLRAALFDLVEEVKRWRNNMDLESPVLHAARETLVRVDCARAAAQGGERHE